MRPFVLRDVSRDDLALFRRIRRAVRRLPDIDLGRDGRGRPVPISCHMLCRALAAHFPVPCRDGYFGHGAATHSWLTTGAGLIIDPYPWAMVGGPVMVYAKGLSPWRTLYREADLSEHLDR
ncbi:MAG: hypothetical protein RL272_820, partial [Candidatus Parcubacteria bacterium]